MSTPSFLTPLDRLAHLERLCLKHAQGLPQQAQTDAVWVGLGFRLGDLRLVTPLDEVSEILTPPRLSQVPRTRAWVCGIANVRGSLMPIIDLNGYLNDQPAVIARRSRILVVNHKGVYSGLVVDAVMGLRSFCDEQRCTDLPGADQCIHKYMSNGFRNGTEHWGIFSMHKLAEVPEFLQIAI